MPPSVLLLRRPLLPVHDPINTGEYCTRSHTKAVCQSFTDAGYSPKDWISVLKSLGGQSELREYIAYVNAAYTPDGIKLSGAEMGPDTFSAVQGGNQQTEEQKQGKEDDVSVVEDSDQRKLGIVEGPPPDQYAIAKLKQVQPYPATIFCKPDTTTRRRRPLMPRARKAATRQLCWKRFCCTCKHKR